jgi:hypothetical protein
MLNISLDKMVTVVEFRHSCSCPFSPSNRFRGKASSPSRLVRLAQELLGKFCLSALDSKIRTDRRKKRRDFVASKRPSIQRHSWAGRSLIEPSAKCLMEQPNSRFVRHGYHDEEKNLSLPLALPRLITNREAPFAIKDSSKIRRICHVDWQGFPILRSANLRGEFLSALRPIVVRAAEATSNGSIVATIDKASRGDVIFGMRHSESSTLGLGRGVRRGTGLYQQVRSFLLPQLYQFTKIQTGIR